VVIRRPKAKQFLGNDPAGLGRDSPLCSPLGKD